MLSKLKQLLAGKVLLILILAGVLGYVDTVTDLKLGLDLKGGTQLDYVIDLSSVDMADQNQIVEGVKEVIRRRVDGLGVSEPNIYISNVADEYHIIVELAGISDIDEAKNTVGKTIQLEFKEENTEPSTDQTQWADSESLALYNAISGGGDFTELVNAKIDEFGSTEVIFSANELQELANYSEKVREAIDGKRAGALIYPFEVDEGYTINSDNNILATKGMAVIQVTDYASEEIKKEIAAEVSARHILVSYDKASSSSSDRSKKEALTRMEEVQNRIAAGETIEALAAEYSDDPGSSANGGDLGTFGAGQMVPEFEEAAFALEIGGISDIVESEYGYHLIEVYDKIEGGIETEVVDKYSINKVVFSTTPDPWAEETVLTGEHFKHADVAFNEAYQPYVSIAFDDEGGAIFEELTGNNIGKRIAIFVGGNLVSAPTVQAKISGGTAQITGDFTLEEAQGLARDLNTGAIPAPIELSGQYTISATLGAEALNESLYAGLIGLVFLAIYMLLYYRLPGLMANIALTIYATILIFCIKIALPTSIALLAGLAIFAYIVHLILKNNDSGGEKLITFMLACVVLFFTTFVLSSQITLTLAGIAGVILSIGMAVDANVLIFERTKEELADDKPLSEAIEAGFSRAWDSIRDSNFSSLITCAILFYFGSSIIRGFALNLALGILISMFSAIMLTRSFLRFTESIPALRDRLWLFGKPRKQGKLMGIIKNTKIWAVFSGSVLTVAVAVTLIFGLNLGLDFTGGTLIEIKFNPAELEDPDNEILPAITTEQIIEQI